MFKDYNKYLRESLKVYLFLLICCFILKLVGLNYFGLELNNKILVKISNYLSNTHWGDLYYCLTIYIQGYFLLCLSTNKQKLYKEALLLTLILYIPQCLINMYYKMDWLYEIWCLIIMFIFPIIINKNKKILKTVKRTVLCILLSNLYQLISMFIRNIGINVNYNNFLIESLLNIDQLLMLAISYNIYFMKGGVKLCGEEVAQFFSLLKKKHYLNLLKKLQKQLQEFNQFNKQEKLTIIIYSIFSLIWNIFTLIVVLFIGKLNDTFIECIFIITSFWLSKKVFGKPFHLKSMIQCFIVSNITYYILNRITAPIGVSILIPIMLGVGLSYITSKLVKKTYKPLYKGMPKEVFEETILKVVDKNSMKYLICYDFYINKENAIYLSHKYNYSEAGIRKITSRVNDSIKAL